MREKFNISELKKTDANKIKMIVLDVDGVLVHRGSIIEQDGNRITYEIKKIGTPEIEMIRKLYEKGFIINISSGRNLGYLMEMFRDVLPYVILTYENGSATWRGGSIFQHTNAFLELIEVRKKLLKVKHKNIKGWEPKEFIITIHCTDRVKEIESIISKYKDIYYIWNGEAYDIGYKTQTKGTGLRAVMKLLKLKKEEVIAVGDNFNDAELVYEAGITVTSDYDRLDADYYVPMPAGVVMSKILELI